MTSLDDHVCAACGGTKHLRAHSPWHHGNVICNPCFMVWYDCAADDITTWEKLGEISLRLKAAGKFPWTGDYAP